MDTEFHESVPFGTSRETSSQGVYVYKAAKTADVANERSSKRRKVTKENHVQENAQLPFVPLLNGTESASLVQLRYSTFRQVWSRQEEKITAVLEELDTQILHDLSSFIADSAPGSHDYIPTALINIGSNVSSFGRLLDRIHNRLLTTKEGGVVVLESEDAPNLKTALKNIIRAGVSIFEGNEGYQELSAQSDGPRLLSYDLEVLHGCVKRHGVRKLAVAFRDSEAFDPKLLSDLLSLLSSWLDRIPFVLLFGVSTSFELFEDRLPRSTVSLLQGKHFEISGVGDSIHRLYESVQTNKENRLWLGPQISKVLLERSGNYFQSLETFGRMVKYACMSHFFANPLSALLGKTISSAVQQSEFGQSIRNLPSFRKFCEDLIDDGNTGHVRSFLNDDTFLFEETKRSLQMNQEKMQELFQSVRVAACINDSLKVAKDVSTVQLTVLALAGELRDSLVMEQILSATREQDSAGLQDLCKKLNPLLDNSSELQKIIEDLEAFVGSNQGAGTLRSGYSSSRSITTTTVVKQQVKLKKSQAKLTKEDSEYTAIVDRLYTELKAHFDRTLIRPQDLFLHEVFLFDLKSPLKDTFAPRTRFAIERVLSNPFDYLLSSSTNSDGQTSAMQPITATLYQLYLESGNLVNVYDLWHAFCASIGGESDDFDERMALTLFYRAFSELKLLGMVKTSRKKVDHVAKTAWRGL
ncbi:origin recognition complex subunit [Paecilomyces variotii No. 5]|uniref:Origin recognition complex subunit n=1 Tax=Byssochlamys spectabilis (strain No. 5 / NBRC 109023) TaxID=1356009 RepID=V5FVM8_BYSSN|nr:origin recognition complex subunit [Paecilomyces variotii No. 5]